jgi:hypothetical protein
MRQKCLVKSQWRPTEVECPITAAERAFDVHRLEASSDYDPAPDPEKIQAAVLAINFPDDESIAIHDQSSGQGQRFKTLGCRPETHQSSVSVVKVVIAFYHTYNPSIDQRPQFRYVTLTI